MLRRFCTAKETNQPSRENIVEYNTEQEEDFLSYAADWELRSSIYKELKRLSNPNKTRTL